jgi:hypothetical protein
MRKFWSKNPSEVLHELATSDPHFVYFDLSGNLIDRPLFGDYICNCIEADIWYYMRAEKKPLVNNLVGTIRSDIRECIAFPDDDGRFVIRKETSVILRCNPFIYKDYWERAYKLKNGHKYFDNNIPKYSLSDLQDE